MTVASSPLLDRLQQKLHELDTQHLRRQRRTVSTPHAPCMTVDGRPIVAFCSNDYLGLAADPRVVEALQQGAALYGAGSGASHLISGHSDAHAALENKLAEFLSPWVPSAGALYFSTGYMANLALISALADKDAKIFSEALNHASLIDGARLARAKLSVYPHRDLQALDEQLRQSQAKEKLVITDAVFSMDGDIAPLRELLLLCEQHGAWLLVDDAHGFGVLGDTGRGVLEHLGLGSPQLIYMGTLGKAAGVAGAFVAAHATVIEWLVQRARAYIYTTASPPAVAHALMTSINIIGSDEGRQRRAHLKDLIARLRERLQLKHWQLLPSETAIQPVIIADNAATMATGKALMEQGFWVGAIRPPTVPIGTARLRITLSAAHTIEQVDQLAAALVSIEKSHS
ncbi:MAG: 8-amino-7-oxononanoate synthase [Oxalobacteraceae bacterium]|nr:8-amino-7-oxononanoate synthase [Oxalobacteraceae bacterium]